MSNELRLSRTGVYSTDIPSPAAIPRIRNLGAAILLAAIRDYRSVDQERHEDAERFLYPITQEWQDHYDWALSLTEGLNPAWVREMLDRLKGRWDRQRSFRVILRRRRPGNLTPP
jgi:hypothetical protein